MSDLIDREEVIKRLKMYGAEHNAIAVINGCPSADTDLSEYSDKLWKNAYERGKAEALRATRPLDPEPEKAKECPFCGTCEDIHVGTIDQPDSWWDSMLRGEGYGYVMCAECGCILKANDVYGAIKRWNRRVEDDD